ncbi:hypothetical protein PP713_13960 [Mycobacterium sp. CSUR Q5927]|nr:hypothetical protein [Mycobacterium sp. CSUR Q5927]
MLISRIEDAIWSELERQSGKPYAAFVDREIDLIDGGVDMAEVAEVIVERFIDRQDGGQP